MKSAGEWLVAQESNRWRFHHRLAGGVNAFVGFAGSGACIEVLEHGFRAYAASVLVVGILQLAAGIGFALANRWPRIVLWPLSVLYLPAFPIGTALGAYTLWVLYQTRGKPSDKDAAAA
jgi:hypothetical protein